MTRSSGLVGPATDYDVGLVVGMMAELKTSAPQGIAGTPNEQALLSLMEKTGYTMIQENGQRKYGGPPPGWEGPAPPRGCEVFVGKIPRDCYEDELVPVFERIGRMYELRLMMDFSGTNRGYCFVMYTSRGDAIRAVRELNNFEIRKGRYLGVCLSVDNCRLFVGGIPKSKNREEILSEMKKVTEGVVKVIVYPSANDKTKNRGFAFVEYESHRAAAMARRKLIPGRIQLWGHQIAVDWAEPEQDVDEEIMSKVKILYVRNLMLTTTEDTVREACAQAAGKDKSSIERVKKIRDYAFVHFTTREDALHAMTAMDGSNLEGSTLEVVLAKPADKDYIRYTRGASGQRPLQGLTTYGYDLPATAAAAYYNPFNPAAAAAAAAALAATSPTPGQGLASPRTSLGVRSPSGRGRGRGAAGMRGAAGRNYIRGASYRKHPADVLEEFCQLKGWGSPVYQLHSTVGRDGGGDVQLFLYKVSIPALAGNGTFQPNKLCRSIEEAKQYAAEYVLLQLGVPVEGAEASTSGYTTPPQVIPPTTTTVYQPGRSIGPAYPYTTSGATPQAPPPRNDLAYGTTTVPVVTTASYVVTPGKMPPIPAPQTHGHGDLAYDATAAGFAAFPAIAGYTAY